MNYNPTMCVFQSIIMAPLAILSLPVASIIMPPDNNILLFIVYEVVILFLIGSLIGLIIGKIKKSKTNNKNIKI